MNSGKCLGGQDSMRTALTCTLSSSLIETHILFWPLTICAFSGCCDSRGHFGLQESPTRSRHHPMNVVLNIVPKHSEQQLSCFLFMLFSFLLYTTIKYALLLALPIQIFYFRLGWLYSVLNFLNHEASSNLETSKEFQVHVVHLQYLINHDTCLWLNHARVNKLGHDSGAVLNNRRAGRNPFLTIYACRTYLVLPYQLDSSLRCRHIL